MEICIYSVEYFTVISYYTFGESNVRAVPVFFYCSRGTETRNFRKKNHELVFIYDYNLVDEIRFQECGRNLLLTYQSA